VQHGGSGTPGQSTLREPLDNDGVEAVEGATDLDYLGE
jgi:hypothetical protein